ncbi:MAG: hypothetical protein U9Q82_12020 [Chloroflexota bacterium]|nr:hypothetical protein [Chloroflexota bacterium]
MSSEYQKRFKKIRAKYPNAYERWSKRDDVLLMEKYFSGSSTSVLSEYFHRQPSAIKTRIRKLSVSQNDIVIEENNNVVENEIKTDENSDNISTSIQFQWITVFREHNQEYFFPDSITSYMNKNYKYPSIYRWNVFGEDRKQPECMYVGTTKQLCPNRIRSLLHSNSSSTNLRLHQEFRRFINKGYRVGLEYLLVEQVLMNGMWVQLNNLHSQTARIFLENLVISYYRRKGQILLNQ